MVFPGHMKPGRSKRSLTRYPLKAQGKPPSLEKLIVRVKVTQPDRNVESDRLGIT